MAAGLGNFICDLMEKQPSGQLLKLGAVAKTLRRTSVAEGSLTDERLMGGWVPLGLASRHLIFRQVQIMEKHDQGGTLGYSPT